MGKLLLVGLFTVFIGALTPARGEVVIRKLADTTNSTTTLADVAGMSITVEANRDYLIEAWLLVDTAVATTGIAVGVNGPASPIQIGGFFRTTVSNGTLDGGGFTSYNQTGQNTSSLLATTGNFVKLDCLFRNGSTAGTFTLRFASEIASSGVTVKAGSVLRYREIGR